MIKDGKTQRKAWKETVTVQWNRDIFKKMLLHYLSVARLYTTELLVGLAATFGVWLFSIAFAHVYL